MGLFSILNGIGSGECPQKCQKAEVTIVLYGWECVGSPMKAEWVTFKNVYQVFSSLYLTIKGSKLLFNICDIKSGPTKTNDVNCK